MELNAENYDPMVRRLHELHILCRKSSVPEAVSACVENVLQLWTLRSQYTEDITSPTTNELSHVASETRLRGSDWMLTGNLAGEFLKSMVKLSKAKHVVDIGTFTGYSALALAEALPEDGTVDTCDIDGEISAVAKAFTSRSKHASKITFNVASAESLLNRFADEGRKFDLFFIDGNKSGYREQYNIIMDRGLLSEQGVILFDNAFMNGYAYMSDGEDKLLEMGRHVADCNDFIKADNRVHKVLVPIRDGILVVQRKH